VCGLYASVSSAPASAGSHVLPVFDWCNGGDERQLRAVLLRSKYVGIVACNKGRLAAFTTIAQPPCHWISIEKATEPPIRFGGRWDPAGTVARETGFAEFTRRRSGEHHRVAWPSAVRSQWSATSRTEPFRHPSTMARYEIRDASGIRDTNRDRRRRVVAFRSAIPCTPTARNAGSRVLCVPLSGVEVCEGGPRAWPRACRRSGRAFWSLRRIAATAQDRQIWRASQEQMEG
jgi:hypothetical protein